MPRLFYFMRPNTKTELLKTIRAEVTKEYQEVDGMNRVVKKYTAAKDAANGEPCFVIEYVYSGTFPTKVIGRKEGYTTWSSAYDF